jgi:hypothetical protein
MSNQKTDWQEMFNSTRKNMWICIVAATAGFWLAGAISAINSPGEISDYTRNNIWIIGTLLFAILATATFLKVNDAKMTAPKKMSNTAQATHKRSIQTMRGFGVWFTMLMCICAIFVTNDTLIKFFSGSIISVSVFAVSLVLFAGSLLSQKMAQFVKTKHLS